MAISEAELNGLKGQLAQINNDLQLYSEEEHFEVERIRTQLRDLIRFYGDSANLAIIATTLEISISKALQ